MFVTQPVAFSVITYIIVSIVILSTIVLVSGSYARSERVVGYLVPSQGLIRIQAGQFGTIGTVYVQEGDTVEQGQILARIEVANTTSEGHSVAEQNLDILARQKAIVGSQVTLEKNQLEAEKAKLAAEKVELELQVKSLNRQIDLQSQITFSAQASYEDVQDLLKKGFISKIESERRKQAWLGQQAQEQLVKQQLVETEARLEQLEIRLTQLPADTDQRLARLQSQLTELDARIVEQRGLQAYSIAAPTSGRIMAVSGGVAGRTVQAGQYFLTIIPDGSALEAELFVPSRAVGFIEAGQEVRLMYDAFPYQRFGTYDATIVRVTETILTPSETQAPFEIQEPVYRVTASLNAQQVLANEKQISLQSGMTLQANIILEKRSMLSWLLGPLRALEGRG